jgi:hypothetical protein
MTMTRVLLAASIVVLALASCKSKLPLRETAPLPPLSFTIISHGVGFTSADANKVIAEENRILVKRTLNLSLQLGNVIAADAITCDGIKELLKAQANDVHEIHVVNSIPCCGSPVNGTIVGCSGAKMPLIVLPIDESTDQGTLRLRAVQWLHELGHNKGLCHIGGVSALMSGDALTAQNIGVDNCTRATFTSGSIDPSCTQSCSGPQQSRVSNLDPGH